MDITHGLLFLLTLATLVATLVLLKQRAAPLTEAALKQEAVESLASQQSSQETSRKMRVSVLDDTRAAIKEAKERAETPNEGLAQ